MPVDTTHGDYNANLHKWRRCRDAIAGDDAIKNGGTAYLPKLSGQDDTEYKSYSLRALFFNATARTIDSFVGMIFRVDPKEQIPAELKTFGDDVTMQSQSMYDYEKFIVREVIGVGRSGTLIDWNQEESRPYVCNYTAEQILNWKTSRVKGRTILSMVVLKECIDEGVEYAPPAPEASGDPQPPSAKPISVNTPDNDIFKENSVEQMRVLMLTPNPNASENLIFMVEIWRKDTTKKWVKISTEYPERRGVYIPELPFVFHNPNNLLPACDKPPMDDIVCVNLSHYRTSADLEHGRHFTGLPTAYFFGVPDKMEVKLGSGTAVCVEESGASCGFLEFTGEGLGALEKAREEKEHQMAVLGARMLEAPKKATETVESIQMKQSGEQSSLAQIAGTLGESFEQIYRWAAWWGMPADSKMESTAESVSVELNTDFTASSIDPAMITALLGAYQGGALSLESLVTTLKAGGLGDPGLSVEDEIELIKSQMTLTGAPLDINADPTKKKTTKGAI